MNVSSPEVTILFDEMLRANSRKSDVLKIKNLLLEYNKGLLLAKQKEFDIAKGVLFEADSILHDLFKKDSFEYYFSQLFALPSRSYLEFKLKKKDQAILSTKKSIEYAIYLQDYPSPPDISGLFISQMLDNLSKIYLMSSENKEWHDITLNNIHFLLNFSKPQYCEKFNISRFKKGGIELRYFMLINVINEALINIIKYKIPNGYKLVESIVVNDKSDDIARLIDCWIKLNIEISNQKTETRKFKKEYNSFLESKHSKFNFDRLKKFLKIRVKEKSIKL